MAACCTNIVVRSGADAFAVTTPSNGWPQPSPATLCRCSCTRQASQSRNMSWGTISVGDSRGPGRGRGRSWDQHGITLQQPRTESRRSPSFCSPTDVSSNASAAASTELNAIEEEGSESGMTVEEKNAILEFEAAGIESEKERNSSEGLQLSSSEQEGKGEEALQAVKDREEEVLELKRRASKAAKGQGTTIANVVTLFMTLLDRPSPGDGKMIAGAGRAVIERVEEEVAKLQGVEGVDGQSLFEILRLVKLLQMDIQLIAAARKDSTLSERLVQAKTRCRQFLNILSML